MPRNGATPRPRHPRHAGGQPDYVLNFTKPGNCTVVNDLRDSFQLNQLNLGVGQGNSFKLEGKGLAFTLNRAAGLLPGIRVNAIFERTVIATPLTLGADLTVRMRDGCEMEWKGLISGPGALILDPSPPSPTPGITGSAPASCNSAMGPTPIVAEPSSTAAGLWCMRPIRGWEPGR